MVNFQRFDLLVIESNLSRQNEVNNGKQVVVTSRRLDLALKVENHDTRKFFANGMETKRNIMYRMVNRFVI